MKNPAHPGRIIREECLPVLNMSAQEAAEALGIDSNVFEEIIHERAPIVANIAPGIAALFGSTADTWLRMQAAFDRAQPSNRGSVS